MPIQDAEFVLCCPFVKKQYLCDFGSRKGTECKQTSQKEVAERGGRLNMSEGGGVTTGAQFGSCPYNPLLKMLFHFRVPEGLTVELQLGGSNSPIP